MKRTILSFFGRKLYSNKIKNFENKLLEIYNEDWSDKPWEDFAKDCFKLETQIKERILNSSGSQRMEYVFSLQALYNIHEKELNYIEETIRNTPITELKYFFKSEYKSILMDLKEKGINSAMELNSECFNIANSKEIQKKYKWRYVSACLVISAVEEVFGNDLDNIQQILRGL
jgi:hypothetical protein